MAHFRSKDSGAVSITSFLDNIRINVSTDDRSSALTVVFSPEEATKFVPEMAESLLARVPGQRLIPGSHLPSSIALSLTGVTPEDLISGARYLLNKAIQQAQEEDRLLPVAKRLYEARNGEYSSWATVTPKNKEAWVRVARAHEEISKEGQ